MPPVRGVHAKAVEWVCGVQRCDFGRAEQDNEIGLVTGLAWTEVGGDLLQIESTLVPGKGNLILTGQLGDVMKESASAALSVVRARTDRLGIELDFLQKLDRSEEHTSEIQSLMRISYAVLCLKKKKNQHI